jgi:hypothetical protein
VLVDRNAEEARAPLVFTDGKQGSAEGRTQEPGHRAGRDREEHEHKIIERDGAVQEIDRSEAKIERLTLPSYEAVIATGHRVPAESDEVKRLAEGDRHHGEIDAAQADDHRPDDRGSNGSGERADDDAEARARHEIFQRHAGTVSAKAEICGVAEGEHAGIAEQEIQRHRREPEHDDTSAEFGIAPDRRQPIRHAEQKQPDDCGRRAFLQIVALHQKRPSSPKRPRGRTNSTAAIIT